MLMLETAAAVFLGIHLLIAGTRARDAITGRDRRARLSGTVLAGLARGDRLAGDVLQRRAGRAGQSGCSTIWAAACTISAFS